MHLKMSLILHMSWLAIYFNLQPNLIHCLLRFEILWW